MSLSLAPSLGEISPIPVLATAAILAIIYCAFFLDEKPYDGFPVVGLEKNGLFKMAKARANWIVNGCQILEAGAKQVSRSKRIKTHSIHGTEHASIAVLFKLSLLAAPRLCSQTVTPSRSETIRTWDLAR